MFPTGCFPSDFRADSSHHTSSKSVSKIRKRFSITASGLVLAFAVCVHPGTIAAQSTQTQSAQNCAPCQQHPYGFPPAGVPTPAGTPLNGSNPGNQGTDLNPSVNNGPELLTPGQQPAGQQPQPQFNQPGTNQQIFQPPAQQPNFDVAGSGNQSLAPGMIGDFFGAGTTNVTTFDGILTTTFEAPDGTTSVVGRQKIVEGASAMPRDRLFLNYSFFSNTGLLNGGVDVNRVTAGFEKTFLDGSSSIEFRMPFAATLDSNIDLGGPNDTNNWEFGNVNATLKTLLLQNQELSVAAGLAVTLPTAGDLVYFDPNGTGVDVTIENDSVHLLPFIGFLNTPYHTNWFSQGFLQFDFDLNGNPVRSGTTNVGTMNDVNFLYLSYGIGYRMQRDTFAWRPGHRRVRSMTPMIELHYSRNLNNGDVVVAGTGGATTLTLGSGVDTVEVLNLVIGSTFEICDSSTLTVGYGLPLTGGHDKQFDGELRVMWNVLTGHGTQLANRSY